MRYIACIAVLQLIITGVACGGSRGGANSRISNAESAGDTLSSWQVWAESSDTGLRSEENRITAELVMQYDQDEAGVYYTPAAVAASTDKVIVADRSGQRIVCMDSNSGDVLWVAGESGEGPGHFSGIGDIAISDSIVYVGNMRNNRVEIFTDCGEYIGYMEMMHPYGLEIMSDTILAVTSLASSDLITLFNRETNEVIKAFGSWNMEYSSGRSQDNNTLLVSAISDSVLVLALQMEGYIRIYNINTEEMVEYQTRTLPYDLPDNTQTASWLHIRDIAVVNDSIIYVLLTPLTTDRTPITREAIGRLADVAVIDRYSIEGEYIGSFIIPDVCYCIESVNNTIYTYHPLNNTVSKYEIQSIQ